VTGPDTRIGDWLENLAARRSTPSGGAAAAVTLAAAAALAAMAARFSAASLEDATGLAQEADALRDRAIGLAAADEAVVATLHPASGPRAARGPQSARQAAEVPLAMVQLAAELDGVFGRLGRGTNPRLVGDAQVGRLLLQGAADAASALAWIDAAVLPAAERETLLEALRAARARPR
jgi:formiminotetrahydrofolate cyclodeaminase